MFRNIIKTICIYLEKVKIYLIIKNRGKGCWFCVRRGLPLSEARKSCRPSMSRYSCFDFWHVHMLTTIWSGPINDLPSCSWATFDLIGIVDDDLDSQRPLSSALGFFMHACMNNGPSLFSKFCRCVYSFQAICTIFSYLLLPLILLFWTGSICIYHKKVLEQK
jgi:hypothetical protein